MNNSSGNRFNNRMKKYYQMNYFQKRYLKQSQKTQNKWKWNYKKEPLKKKGRYLLTVILFLKNNSNLVNYYQLKKKKKQNQKSKKIRIKKNNKGK